MLAEIGIKPVKMMIKKKKLIYAHRIITMKEEKLIHKVTAGNSIWRQEIELILKEYSISEQQMSNYNKKELSNELDRRNESLWKKIIVEEAENKSKVNHWMEMKGEIPNKRPEYMNKLTRKQCHAIMKARSRMIPCKINQRNRYSNTTCRLCDNEEESQIHLTNNCSKVPTSERDRRK